MQSIPACADAGNAAHPPPRPSRRPCSSNPRPGMRSRSRGRSIAMAAGQEGVWGARGCTGARDVWGPQRQFVASSRAARLADGEAWLGVAESARQAASCSSAAAARRPNGSSTHRFRAARRCCDWGWALGCQRGELHAAHPSHLETPKGGDRGAQRLQMGGMTSLGRACCAGCFMHNEHSRGICGITYVQ